MGYLLSQHLPQAQVLKVIAAPYYLVIVTCLVLGMIYLRRVRRRGDGAGVSSSPP